MRILRTLEDLAGLDLPRPLGLVPTMGALHAAHRLLADRSRGECRSTVVTIFVNPKQFRPGEDFERYPRDIEGDIETVKTWSIDAVFLPDVATVFPKDFETVISIPKASGRLCGAFRPGHFDGVLTVVARLFGLFHPDRAYFGWKDAQQLLLIERMVKDLGLPVAIVGVESLRETDGLAYSSRNRGLAPAERAKAPLLYNTLRATAQRIRQGAKTPEAIQMAKDSLAKEGFQVEYIAFEEFEGVQLLAGAAKIGKTRLIDNIRLS